MNRALVFTSISLMLAAAAACATSDDETSSPPPSPEPNDSGTIPAEDSSPPPEAASDAPIGPSGCSPAGWCVTTLPDADLTLKDIWALAGHAFAIAESPTLGVRVLEWKDADESWSYIDDNTQNESGAGQYAGKIWAPSESELYYTAAPRRVYHGKRTTGGTWSWTYDQLVDPLPPVPDAGAETGRGKPKTYTKGVNFSTANLTYVPFGVFGTSADDVYAWYENIIYHATRDDAGNLNWAIEYVADDIDDPTVYSGNYEQLFFLAAAGSSKDDLWFTGGRGQAPPNSWPRGSCVMAVRKTAEGYRRVIDGFAQRASYPNQCAPKEGKVFVSSTAGWLTNLQSVAPGRLVGIKGGKDVAQIAADGDNVTVRLTPIPRDMSKMEVFSLWAEPSEALWFGGFNRVIRADMDAGDGGAWEISTISLNGGWLETPVYQIRGSSNVDRWAVGAGYALHKTTP